MRDAVDERRDLVTDAELESTGRRRRPEDHLDRVDEPARKELVLGCRRPERASTPERELSDHGLQLEAVLRELVDARGGRPRKDLLPDDAVGLEVAEPRREDVGADAG